jgi:SAM-dependent methyltransferase
MRRVEAGIMSRTIDHWSNLVRFIATCGVIVLLVCFISAGSSPAQTPSPQMTGGSEHGFHHSFSDIDTWVKEFDDPARDVWQKPDGILDALRLVPSARVADIGAGTGYFSVRIAKRVPNGKVFAVDIEPEMLRYLERRAHRERLHMLQPVQASAESPNLPEPVDLALMVDTYHHIDGRVAYFSRLKSSLRPGGHLAIVDFKTDAPEGPPAERRIPAEQVTSELKQAGYTLFARYEFLPRQYFVFQAR